MSDQRSEAEQLYLKKHWTMEAIAQKFAVSRRTIERWASEGEWTTKKKASKVVSINQPVNKTSSPPENYSPARSRRRAGQIDEMEIIENAIVSLDLLLSSMGGMSDDERAIDTRGIGSTAGALVKLLEYRRKVQPPTAAALADLVIELGISPTEFVAELKQKWLQRA